MHATSKPKGRPVNKSRASQGDENVRTIAARLLMRSALSVKPKAAAAMLGSDGGVVTPCKHLS